MKKFLNDFKAFALRGNVLDMAVGIIIGGAFTGIVTALTDNFIKPILAFILAGARYEWSDIGYFAANFGTAVLNFILMAFILFILVSLINKLLSMGKKKEAAAPTTKKCPFCKSDIPLDAVKCAHCTSDIPTEE